MFIYLVLIMGTMSFIRKKTRKGKDGGKLEYYSLVENRWENGKVRQKVLKYLGTSPNTMELPLDPKIAGQVAQILMTKKLSQTELKETLEKLGVHFGPGNIKKLSLVYDLPR